MAMCFFNVINWQVISFQLIAGLTPGGFLCSGYKFIVWNKLKIYEPGLEIVLFLSQDEDIL